MSSSWIIDHTGCSNGTSAKSCQEGPFASFYSVFLIHVSFRSGELPLAWGVARISICTIVICRNWEIRACIYIFIMQSPRKKKQNFYEIIFPYPSIAINSQTLRWTPRDTGVHHHPLSGSLHIPWIPPIKASEEYNRYQTPDRFFLFPFFFFFLHIRAGATGSGELRLL